MHAASVNVRVSEFSDYLHSNGASNCFLEFHFINLRPFKRHVNDITPMADYTNTLHCATSVCVFSFFNAAANPIEFLSTYFYSSLLTGDIFASTTASYR